MSQRLSTSATFQSLNGRVSTIEARFTGGGNLLLKDAQRLPLIDLTKDGVVNWRLGNWNGDAATNAFSIGFNATATVTFDTAGNAKFGGCVDAAYVRSTAAIAPGSGAGIELQWDGAAGYLLSFDRGAGAFKPVTITGSNISINPQGGVVAINGTTTFGDANFGTSYSGPDPLLAFDAGDYFGFSRSTNTYHFIVGGASQLDVSAGVVSADRFQAPAFYASAYPSCGTVQIKRSSTAAYTGIVEFLKSDGTRNGFVGFNPDAGAMQYGSDTGAGHAFSGGPVAIGDANFQQNIVGGKPTISFDTGGDQIAYDRSGNALTSYIGGAAQLTISPSGTFVANVLTVGDASLALSLNGGTTPFLAFDANDYLQYNRTSNVYAFNVGGATKATIDSGGNLSATGSIFPSGDANYLLGISSGAPTITFDSGDSIQFNRTTNTFAFTVGGSGKAFVSAGGIEASALVSDSYVAAATYVQAGDVNFGINFNGGTPILQFDAGDYMQYNRAANSFSFNIGNVAKAIIDSAGNFSNSGSIQPSGDASYLLQMNGGNPLIIFDTNDLIRYDRAANKFYFVIGGVNVASIDASGNMRIKGTLAQGVTP